jgi:DNA mismatch endonuclease (patch repair protein)
VDVVSKEKRSQMMAGIKGRDTRPEMIVRKLLFAHGFRYRLHRKDLPGCPDLVLTGHKLAIFVHGCFWHQHANCDLAKLPATNEEFWRKKLGRNVRRDRQVVEELKASGWRVLVVHECAIRRLSQDRLLQRITRYVGGSRRSGEIAGAAAKRTLGRKVPG